MTAIGGFGFWLATVADLRSNMYRLIVWVINDPLV